MVLRDELLMNSNHRIIIQRYQLIPIQFFKMFCQMIIR